MCRSRHWIRSRASRFRCIASRTGAGMASASAKRSANDSGFAGEAMSTARPASSPPASASAIAAAPSECPTTACTGPAQPATAESAAANSGSDAMRPGDVPWAGAS
jgi:hypothetical protein